MTIKTAPTITITMFTTSLEKGVKREYTTNKNNTNKVSTIYFRFIFTPTSAKCSYHHYLYHCKIYSLPEVISSNFPMTKQLITTTPLIPPINKPNKNKIINIPP